MWVQNIVLELTYLRILPFVPAWVINMTAPVRLFSINPPTAFLCYCCTVLLDKVFVRMIVWVCVHSTWA